MVYVVVEIQRTGESGSVLTTTFTDRNLAESDYHRILRSAAISTIPVHSAVLLTDTGKTLKTEKYEHEVEE